MVGGKINIAPEHIAEARRLYELTRTPVPDIAALIGVSRKTLERRVHEWKWTPRSAPRLEADRAAAAGPAPSAAQERAADDPRPPALAGGEADIRHENAVRIQQLVANSLDAVSRVLAKVGPADEGGAERSARTLAAVARTLQEMSAIAQPDHETPQDEPHDNNDANDVPPLDIDEFRRELARRLRGIIDARRARISGRLDGPAAESEPTSV